MQQFLDSLPTRFNRFGFEIEMMAPKGLTRKDLAVAISQVNVGSLPNQTQNANKLLPIFYPQSDVLSDGTQLETLTRGFEIRDYLGNWLFRCVDDVTLQFDLDEASHSSPIWYQICAAERTLLDLAEIHCNPETKIDTVLEPIARLFNSEIQKGDGHVYALNSKSGPLMVAVPHLKERERACEVIIKPVACAEISSLQKVFDHANQLGFFVPKESALHVHLDAHLFQNARALQNLVRTWIKHGQRFCERAQTNTNCTRLGPWPEDFISLVLDRRFADLDWRTACHRVNETSINKWCDFNILGLFYPFAKQPTLEFRVFGTQLSSDRLKECAIQCSQFLDLALSNS